MTEGSTEEIAGRRPEQGRRTDHPQDKTTPLRPPSTSRKSTYSDHLEELVKERTAELELANLRLRTEITEREQAKEALRKTALFPEQNPFPVVRIGSDRTLLYANSGAAALLDTWNCRVGRAVPDQVHEAIEQALRTGDPGEIEVPCGPILYSIAIAPIQTEGYANLYGYDITERKAAEEALAAGERKYRELIETTNSVILRWDREGILQFVNEPGARFLGYEPHELVGRHVAILVPEVESTGRNLSSLVQDILDRPEQHVCSPNENVRKDGTRVWIAWTNKAITDNDASVREILAVGNDITALKEAEQALQEANERLQAQSEELAAINEELQMQTEELQVQAEELRNSERALRESEARMRTMLDHMPVGVWFTDSDGTIVYGNEAGQKIWVGARYVGPEAFHEYKGWWFETGAPIEPQEWAVVRAVRNGQTSLNEIIEIECFDGTHKIIHNSAVPVRAGDGRILGCVILNEDITERIAAQEALADREQRLRTALEGGQMGLWEWDVAKDVAVWDERACELLGDNIQNRTSSETFLGHVHCDDRDLLRARLAEALATGGDFQAEFRIVHPNGETVWLTSRSTIVRDDQGRGVRMLGILFDVTQRKHLEEALRHMNDELEEEVQAQTQELQNAIARLQEEVARRRLAEKDLQERSRLLEGFFRHTITPLAFMDRHFDFVQVNDAYARVDDKDPDYFVGKNHFAIYPNAQNQVIFEKVVRTKQLYHALAKPFAYAEHPERTISYWNWQLTPLLDETGEVQYLVLNLQDVTERQRTMEELKTRTSQLQRLTAELSEAEDRERHRLAELLHDDLQQLLVGSKLRLNMVARKVKETPEIHTLVEETTALIAESIEKSRGLSHELSPPVLHHGDFGEVLQWLAEQIRATCGLKVRLRIGDDTDVRSQALKTFIYKAAREMLFNIVKHANVKRAAIVVQMRNGSIHLTVCDRGRGFDPQRLDVASQNGFGLFHIRERLQLLGGAMTVRSAPGRGSRFVLTIPLEMTANTTDRKNGGAVSPLSPKPVMQRKVNGAAKRKIRILLVDDHKVMRDGLAALLEEEPDIEVVGQAGNGRDAITLTAQLKPEVVVMDVVMPIINGEEATRQIKERWPDVRIVALSMLEEDATRERMLGAGAEAFLSKAGPSEVIAAAIRQLS